MDDADGQALSVTRVEYIALADPLGSVPPPATLKGAAKSGAKMLTGNRPQAFIDKLAERLAFERGGTWLYDAVYAKAVAHEEVVVAFRVPPGLDGPDRHDRAPDR